jgi:creatinine amidohydrolase
MNQKYLDYMLTKPKELADYITENPIAYIPFGSLEWHGHHMILGVDSLKAVYLCQKCAEITGGVLFPCVNWGAFDTMNFPFTFHFNKKNLIRITREMMKQLYNMGLRIIILLTGHYPGSQVTNVRKAAQKFTKKYRSKNGFALGIPEQALIPDLGYIGDHAAEWETSIMMAINPAFVDLGRLTQNLKYSERCARHGIMGRDPLLFASAEKGQQAIDEIVRRLTGAIQEIKETQSSIPFDKIYENYQKALGKLYNPKIIFHLDKLFELVGFENKHEL